ncbi:MAG: SEC-C domain-containing protein [Eubacterium sp.]|jgi:hypothetical protein|nr:SEC-C domain-containing protein [Eubacterium sp.]MCH4047609.1 SEC-C domain-containing protein [Eubacterium sp.]MCH4078381.1 SEC-C domain-containing protein [Eubacterium sp.]MCH4109525.1 SEC-C domain-containing protein [Eubacterium sp.]MCI1306621.1 SEC-C domain-containing protein [Eubacterium sp.]
MSLYQEWNDLLKNQTNDSFPKFWEKYAAAERAIYTYILEHKDEKFTGKVSELAEKFDTTNVIFTGFLDGVQESLEDPKSLDLEAVTEDTEISLSIDFKKLYYNMHKAEADHLFSLEAWSNVLSEEERAEITKSYKQSKIYHAPKKPGRNDPCPCGSGKKYKNCCGKNA